MISIGNDFRAVATPSQEQLRHLLYLAEQDNDSVLTVGVRAVGASGQEGKKDRDAAADALETQVTIQTARLADPAYQEMSARMNDELDQLDERSVSVLQQIEEALSDLRREREELLTRVYRDEHGRPIAMTEDGTAAYYVDEEGGRVDDETFLSIREDLEGGSTYEQFVRITESEQEFYARRDAIHEGMEAGDQLREDLAEGAISPEEAEQKIREIRESQDVALSAAEEAIFEARDDAITPDAAASEPAAATIIPAATPAP